MREPRKRHGGRENTYGVSKWSARLISKVAGTAGAAGTLSFLIMSHLSLALELLHLRSAPVLVFSRPDPPLKRPALFCFLPFHFLTRISWRACVSLP